MGEMDRGRVEMKTILVGRGIGSTPERISDIERRTREVEKLNRQAPTEQFSSVLEKKSKHAPVAEPSPKAQKQQALPRKGPRPALAHPGQRDSFGRDEKAKEPVVLKG